MTDRYEIMNFKSIRSAQLELTGADVFVGMNSAGKSSIIQPLLLLRQSSIVGSLNDGYLALNGPLINLGTLQDAFSEFADEDATKVSWNDAIVEVPYSTKAATSTEPSAKIVRGAAGVAVPPFSNVIYISTNRLPPQVLYQRHHQYDSASPMVGVQGEGAPGYLAAHANVTPSGRRSSRNEGSQGTLLEQVNTWMHKISPDVSVTLNELHELDGLELRFKFDGAGGLSSRPYRAANVGYGLSHSLSIVLALIAAEEGTMVILEGPEAHLHPLAQRQLGILIGQAVGDGVRVIVETHSPAIVRGLGNSISSGYLDRKLATMHYCSRRESETSIANVQFNQNGRLFRHSGFDEVPDEYLKYFLDSANTH